MEHGNGRERGSKDVSNKGTLLPEPIQVLMVMGLNWRLIVYNGYSYCITSC